MRNAALICFCLTALLLCGCYSRNYLPDPGSQSSGSVSASAGKSSFFSPAISEFRAEIEDQIDAVDDQIRMSFWATPGAEFFFTKDGTISQAFFYLDALTEPSQTESITTSHILEYHPDPDTGDLTGTGSTYNEDMHLIKSADSDRQVMNFKYFGHFMDWADGFDPSELLSDSPSEAVLYELMAGHEVPYGLLTDDSSRCRLLDVSSGTRCELSEEDIPILYTDTGGFCTYYENQGTELPLVYYVLLSYYPAGSAEGWTPEQISNDIGSYLSDQKAWDQDYRSVLADGNYVVNDICLLFPDGIPESGT